MLNSWTQGMKQACPPSYLWDHSAGREKCAQYCPINLFSWDSQVLNSSDWSWTGVFLSVTTIRLTLVLPQPLIQRVTCLKVPGWKRVEREVEPRPQSDAKVRNEWSIVCTPQCTFIARCWSTRKTFARVPREKMLTSSYEAVTEESQFSRKEHCGRFGEEEKLVRSDFNNNCLAFCTRFTGSDIRCPPRNLSLAARRCILNEMTVERLHGIIVYRGVLACTKLGIIWVGPTCEVCTVCN